MTMTALAKTSAATVAKGATSKRVLGANEFRPLVLKEDEKMLVKISGFATTEVWGGDGENLVPSHKKVFEESPKEISEDELEGVMYDVASIVDNEHDEHDWVTVVAHVIDESFEPFEFFVIDFGRGFPTPNADGSWEPSRDYWHDEEIPYELTKEV